ncbi:MAG: D-aminoacyl-tRNA deacylase [Dehalococcoidia bacterium]
MSSASVSVGEEEVASIGRGFLVLLGIAATDTAGEAERLARRVAGLRIFEDDTEKMNLALADIDGEVLCVSQFTLYGDVRRGRRPSFTAAAPPEHARPLYDAFCSAIDRAGIRCRRGRFQEHMHVALVNDGPVTLIIDTADLDRPRRS